MIKAWDLVDAVFLIGILSVVVTNEAVNSALDTAQGVGRYGW